MPQNTSDPNVNHSAPIENIDTKSIHQEPEDGMALCLSGGGYRAMLFHLGALWRLNEAGILPKLKRISSVSGGSITAGVLGVNWSKLSFDDKGVATNFVPSVVNAVRHIAGKTIDRKAIFVGAITPGSIGDKLIKAYDKYLFEGKTLQDLPDDPPRFVINATNVQSGALMRFMKPYMRDWRVGEVKKPHIPLSVAVAASSAFPPVLSPVDLELSETDFTPDSGVDLQKRPYTTDVVLSDGGVYDNLGLETVWKRYKTILVGDGGGKMEAQADPKRDWIGHTIRVLNVIDNQVRSLRKRQVIGSFQRSERKGTYWGIRTNIADYELPDIIECPHHRTLDLANVATRLKRLNELTQERLINWGYAVTDAAIRRHLDNSIIKGSFPYSDAAV